MKSWFVKDDSLKARRDGLELDIRLPWYRSLPLSVIDFGDILINGSKFEHSAIDVDLNGRVRKLSELAGLWQEYWFVLDSALLRIPVQNPKQGEDYEVEINMTLHPPYVPKVFFPSTHKKRMRAS
jgi:hypothetical protein